MNIPVASAVAAALLIGAAGCGPAAYNRSHAPSDAAPNQPRLNRNETGVLPPPQIGDEQVVKRPPPEASNQPMPVLPPPGTPGGDPSRRPK